MREIKFRGKRINNVGWEYGYYVKHETRQICPIGDDKLQLFEIKHLIVIDSFADWNMPRRLEGIEVIPETVGQYTGLRDKNGVEIYEGDIVLEKNCNIWEEFTKDDGSKWSRMTNEIEDRLYRVYYDEKTCQFTINRDWLWTLRNLAEVIGNIYDNPELVEEVE